MLDGPVCGGRAIALVGGIGNISQPSTHMYKETCTDEDSGDWRYTNSLDLNKQKNLLGWTTGQVSSAYHLEQYVHKMDYSAQPWFSAFPGMLTDQVAATQALSRVNPSRPVVDVGQFIGELKDAPKMIFQIGDLLRKIHKAKLLKKAYVPTKEDIAGGYLGWVFGWEPLISDLVKLLDFSEAVDNRIRELEALKAGDLRRTYTAMDTEHLYTTNPVFLGPSYAAVASIRYESRIQAKKWVRVRYKPSAATLRMLGDDLRDQARSLVFGHNLHYSTLWELMPWSWLIDWFTTAGDYFAANRNHLQVTVDDIAVMTQITANPVRFWWHQNPYAAEFILEQRPVTFKRRRRVTGPSITAYIPFLGWKKWSILSALAVTRLYHG